MSTIDSPVWVNQQPPYTSELYRICNRGRVVYKVIRLALCNNLKRNSARKEAAVGRLDESTPVPCEVLCPQYGGLVTTTSTDRSGSPTIKSWQSPRMTMLIGNSPHVPSSNHAIRVLL